MNDTIENIINLIMQEANYIMDGDLSEAICHVHTLVNVKVSEIVNKIREAERAAERAKNLRKEITDD